MRIFISYAHVDKPIVQDWIVSKLLAGGHDVWFDARLIAGQEWKQQLSCEIERSDVLVYCITPESMASEWCQWEVAKAVDLGKSVVPVLMQARTQLPDQLKQLQFVDFSEGPTGDAVARLIGGLQNISPVQLSPVATDSTGNPPHAIEQKKVEGRNIIMKLIRDPLWQFVGVVIAIVTIVIGINSSSESVDPPPSPVQQTSSTPRIEALQNIDIREGPEATFRRIAVLNAGGHLDLLGISQDNRWYMVLLSDGSTGWVVNSTSTGRISGNVGILSIIAPTPAGSPTYSITSITTNAPPSKETLLPIPIQSLPSVTDGIQPPTEANRSSNVFPCAATVISPLGATRLNVLHRSPNTNSRIIGSLAVGEQISVQQRQVDQNTSWYFIVNADKSISGWLETRYVYLSEGCP